MATSWTFLTNHARVLLCISRDPGIRLRDIADRVGITERSAYGIVQDLAEAGYIFKEKDGCPRQPRARSLVTGARRSRQRPLNGRGRVADPTALC